MIACFVVERKVLVVSKYLLTLLLVRHGWRNLRIGSVCQIWRGPAGHGDGEGCSCSCSKLPHNGARLRAAAIRGSVWMRLR